MYGNLGQHIRERIQTCHPKGKTYKDAQLGEFVHSVAVEQLLEHELACGSEPAWEREEGEPVAEQQPPRASGCEAATSSRGRRLGVVEALLLEKHQAPLPGAPNVELVLRHFHRRCYRSSPAVVLLLEGGLISWSLGMDERGGHEDLRGSSRRSVIPYVHRRTELYCSSLSFSSANLFLTPRKRYLPGPFIAQGRVVTMRPGARQVVLRWLKPYTTSSAIMARSS
jgi:hypothetical protein